MHGRRAKGQNEWETTKQTGQVLMWLIESCLEAEKVFAWTQTEERSTRGLTNFCRFQMRWTSKMTLVATRYWSSLKFVPTWSQPWLDRMCSYAKWWNCFTTLNSVAVPDDTSDSGTWSLHMTVGQVDHYLPRSGFLCCLGQNWSNRAGNATISM